MRRLLILPATLVALLLLLPATSGAAPHVPGEAIVKYRPGTSEQTMRKLEREVGARGRQAVPGGARKLDLGAREVGEAVSRLRESPLVAYAVPNFVATASDYLPNDPGFRLQWNLSGPAGINMPEAWGIARRLKRPGGWGTTVAVLDTGVAYQRFRMYRRAPDLNRFVRGYDFVDEDRHPNDENGHGTHVAGTIAQSTGNRIGSAGIAYRARIMPIRVLDRNGAGDTVAIARGIRFAARNGAQVINLSLEFDANVRSAQIPDIVSAMRYARSKGALVVAASGNQGAGQVAYPARAKYAIAVGATTVRGCRATYSNSGPHIDLVAPGGGSDVSAGAAGYEASTCRPELGGEFIYQQTFASGKSFRRFGLPPGFEGTSMAAPHVSGVAALLISTGRLGKRPSPVAIERHLKATSRDLGAPGWDQYYGAGLLDAAAALR